MPTRRDSLRQGVAVSIAGLMPAPIVPCLGQEEAVGEQASEWLYAGKPMDYWIAEQAGNASPDPALSELDQNSVLSHFGQAAVPHLIEALKNPWDLDALTQFGFLKNPETARLLIRSLTHEHESVERKPKD